MSKTLYIVIENFRNGDAVPVYRRFRDRGCEREAAPVWLFIWRLMVSKPVSRVGCRYGGRTRSMRPHFCQSIDGER